MLDDIKKDYEFPTERTRQNGQKSDSGNFRFDDEGVARPNIIILTSSPPQTFTTNSVYEVAFVELASGVVVDITAVNDNGFEQSTSSKGLALTASNRGTVWEVYEA